MTDLTPGSTAQLANGGNYILNGGRLEFSKSDDVAPPGAIATAVIGSGYSAKTSSISIGIAADMADTYPNAIWVLNIKGEVNSDFTVGYVLLSNGGQIQVVGTFDGTATTISYIMTYNGNTATLKLVFEGNPYALELDLPHQIRRAWGNSSVTDKLTMMPCYLAGTMIETPDGERTVESLSSGDMIYVYKEGIRHVRSLRWVGHQTVQASVRDEMPIRILAHALAENSPTHDLLVTPEHCLYLDGRFVPVRMLVNNRSIVVEDRTSFEIYHIETDPHSIIIANGVLSESYLDTGNRHGFATEDALAVGHFDKAKHWSTDSAAPLDTSREFVEPIYRHLCSRADSVGFAQDTRQPKLTRDAAITLITSTGAMLLPQRSGDNLSIFRIPAGTGKVWLATRTARPSDTIGPFFDDRRELGVLVGDITLFASNGTHFLTAHRECEDLSGWHALENTTCRWTKGMALIDLDGGDTQDSAILTISVLSSNLYFESETDATFHGHLSCLSVA